MATKTEVFRYEYERSGVKKSARGLARAPHPRNYSKRQETRAVYSLEGGSSRPSRRSTRRSTNRSNPSHPQRLAKSGESLRAHRRLKNVLT